MERLEAGSAGEPEERRRRLHADVRSKRKSFIEGTVERESGAEVGDGGQPQAGGEPPPVRVGELAQTVENPTT